MHNIEIPHQVNHGWCYWRSYLPNQASTSQIQRRKEVSCSIHLSLVQDISSWGFQNQKRRFKNIAISHHLTKHVVGFINRLQTYPMRKVLMTTHSKHEVSRHGSPPTFNPPNIWILVESVVELDKIENFRIRLQRPLVWNLKICPTTRPDKIVSQRQHTL